MKTSPLDYQIFKSSKNQQVLRVSQSTHSFHKLLKKKKKNLKLTPSIYTLSIIPIIKVYHRKDIQFQLKVTL